MEGDHARQKYCRRCNKCGHWTRDCRAASRLEAVERERIGPVRYGWNQKGHTHPDCRNFWGCVNIGGIARNTDGGGPIAEK